MRKRVNSKRYDVPVVNKEGVEIGQKKVRVSYDTCQMEGRINKLLGHNAGYSLLTPTSKKAEIIVNCIKEYTFGRICSNMTPEGFAKLNLNTNIDLVDMFDYLEETLINSDTGFLRYTDLILEKARILQGAPVKMEEVNDERLLNYPCNKFIKNNWVRMYVHPNTNSKLTAIHAYKTFEKHFIEEERLLETVLGTGRFNINWVDLEDDVQVMTLTNRRF